MQVDAWVARKVASMTRALPREAVVLVDAAVAECVGSESPARIFTLTEAKVIEADPVAHAAKVEAERRKRHVSLSRCDEFGLRHVIARISAGDAAWMDATVDRVADILSSRAVEGDPRTRQEWRAEAFGWLARPAELLQLLLEAQEPTLVDAEPSRATAFPAGPLRPPAPGRARRPVHRRGPV